jgi:hypothetical protein
LKSSIDAISAHCQSRRARQYQNVIRHEIHLRDEAGNMKLVPDI